MTFLQLCQIVRQECGVQGQGPSSVVGQTGLLKRIVDWVAAADILIQSKHSDWDFLWTEYTQDTVIGSDTLVKPNDFGMWDRESFAAGRGTVDGRPLTLVDYKDWRQNNYLKANQLPTAITIAPNSNLRLTQPADCTCEIYACYWKAPTLMTTNAEVPPYPERFQRATIARAKMWFFEDQEAWDNFKLAKDEFEEWMIKLEGFALPGQQPRSQAQPAQMVVRPL